MYIKMVSGNKIGYNLLTDDDIIQDLTKAKTDHIYLCSDEVIIIYNIIMTNFNNRRGEDIIFGNSCKWKAV